MSFISYAQNFEDVMLWRALRHIEIGFYIDVGANDPETHSVTKAFYELGWRGINVEPVPQWFQRLQETRVRDINLQLALGSEPDEILLYEIPDTGLSTAEKAFAKRHEAEGGFQSRELKVRQDTLANICGQYHAAPIHFLKIDVEGMERAVLEGADFAKSRPWIVLVESIVPMTPKECYNQWENILLSAGYKHVYNDGINRFYVADEHSELLNAFQYPPNFFDDFVLKSHLENEARAKRAEAHAEAVESQLARIQADTIECHTQLEHSVVQIEQLKEKLQASENKVYEANSQAKTSESEREETKRRLEETETHAQEAASELAKSRADIAAHQHQLENSASQIEQLEHERNEKEKELESKLAELQQESDRSQWLQNEWDAAKVQYDELSRLSHHWWSVADGLNHELQSIYQSKFWRLTWPLRKAMQVLKGVFQFLTGLVRLPKKAVRWLLTNTISYILRRDRLKHRARRYLYRYPKLEAHLRAFARSRGLIPSFISPQHHVESTERAEHENGEAQVHSDASTANAEPLSILTPRARRIYKDLKTAIEKRQGSIG